MFTLQRASNHVRAGQMRRPMAPGTMQSLDADVRGFFAAAGDGPPVLVGALPFDVRRSPLLYQPEDFARGQGAAAFPAGAAGLPGAVAVRPVPAPGEYMRMVRRALQRIERGDLGKVVLARSLRIELSQPFDIGLVARRLALDPAVATFVVALPACSGRAPLTLVGATPELLVSRSGDRVVSHPLAGSAARSPDAAADADAARALLASAKDRREHALVVEQILDLLAPHCLDLPAPPAPELCSTASMWHFGTRIEGRLRADAPTAAGLAALLHPTPAVGGFPRRPALDLIRELEPVDRGFYAGAVGWTEANGDGDWHVTLRCAQVEGSTVTLHAGAGIVAGSDPERELAETTAKFAAMLGAIELTEQGLLLEAAA